MDIKLSKNGCEVSITSCETITNTLADMLMTAITTQQDITAAANKTNELLATLADDRVVTAVITNPIIAAFLEKVLSRLIANPVSTDTVYKRFDSSIETDSGIDKPASTILADANCNYKGWSISLCKDGHYQGMKRINGKIKGIHVGRHLDTEIIDKKIAALLAKHGLA